MKRALFGLFIVALTLGCSDFDRFYKEKKAASVTPKEDSVVVARVGSERITRGELMRSIEGLPVRQRALYLSSPQRLKDYLESYIDQMVLYKEAEKRGIGNREDVRQSLEDYKRRLLVQTLAREVSTPRFSDEDMKRYYDENPKSFEQIRMGYILIRANQRSGITEEEARAKAESIAKRAKSGESFERLAGEFSDDPASKRRGGDTGYIETKRLPEDIRNRISNLREGEISDPIGTQNGFYIIKLTEAPKVPPFDRVRGKVEIEMRKRSFSEYIRKLKGEMGVEIFEDNLKEISKDDPKSEN